MKALPIELADLETTNAIFREEVDRFRLHYRCGSCAHVQRATMMCSMGYPNDFMLGRVNLVHADGNLTFCKYFELGETLLELTS